MSSVLEAKYIHIIWQDKINARKIVESLDALELESVDDKTVKVEIVNYSRIEHGSQGQFAIRLASHSSDVPRFLLENGSTLDMHPVVDPITGQRWWVEGTKWDNQRERWLSDIYRGVGQVTIQMGANICIVNISSSTFSLQQLDSYLQDFRNDFWELILDESSYISGAAKQSQYNLVGKSILQAIPVFIAAVDRVLQKPKVELKEVQSLKPYREVRPVPRTFMELSTRGPSKMLTSRAYKESLDVPENRYAHYAVLKVFQIIKALHTIASNQFISLERSLETHQSRLRQFSVHKIINEDVVMYDFRDKEKRLISLKNVLEVEVPIKNRELERLVHKQHSSIQLTYSGERITSLIVIPTGRANFMREKPFFANIRYHAKDLWFKPANSGCVTVDFGFFSEYINTDFEYEIHGEIERKITNGEKGVRYGFKLHAVTSIRIRRSKSYVNLKNRIDKDEKQIKILQAKKWTRPLTQDESEQQRREVIALEKMIELIEKRKKNVQLVSLELTPKLPVLRAALSLFKKEKIGLDARLPNSMAYVQNPSYQGVHRFFTVIKDQAGINDDEILMALDRIDDIGLVNISMLYERWCLLQIIKVLRFTFHYQAEIGWKHKLIAQVFTQRKNITINFEHTELKRKLQLHYEMELETGRRPDFILDVIASSAKDNSEQKKRFVMDAKFYQDINSKRHGGLGRVINELYQNKDYSQGGANAVFVLHATPSSQPVRATPQDWAKDHYYGEVPLFDWDESFPRHQYGGIFLSPVENRGYLDALQRVLGLFLQFSIESEQVDKTQDGALPKFACFCLVCGSSDLNHRNSPKNKYAWWVTCNECHHFTTYNYCAGCYKRLVKNGEYWTYHAIEPLNATNIKCPSCGDLL